MTDNYKAIELKNGERLVLGWDIARIESKMDTTLLSAVWSVDSGTSVEVLTSSSNNSVLKALIDCVEDGCAILKTVASFNDNQKVNFYYEITVTTPTC